jgi:hypothetical protein
MQSIKRPRFLGLAFGLVVGLVASLALGQDVFMYPTQGQSPEQQNRDTAGRGWRCAWCRARGGCRRDRWSHRRQCGQGRCNRCGNRRASRWHAAARTVSAAATSPSQSGGPATGGPQQLRPRSGSLSFRTRLYGAIVAEHFFSRSLLTG